MSKRRVVVDHVLKNAISIWVKSSSYLEEYKYQNDSSIFSGKDYKENFSLMKKI